MSSLLERLAQHEAAARGRVEALRTELADLTERLAAGGGEAVGGWQGAEGLDGTIGIGGARSGCWSARKSADYKIALLQARAKQVKKTPRLPIDRLFARPVVRGNGLSAQVTSLVWAFG